MYAPNHPTKADYDEALRAIKLTHWKQSRDYYQLIIDRYQYQNPPQRDWVAEKRMTEFRKMKTGKIQ
jgi:hypothetical protein